DMGVNGCFQHASCDGTAWTTRIASYYALSGTMGENIAAGYPAPADPRYAMSMWLCDASGGSCCADRTGCDGHRANIMNGGYRAMGPGYANVSGNYRNYWTQDFGGVSGAPAIPLVDGSHVFFPSGRITFLANFVDSAAPRSVKLVLSGSEVAMDLDLGSAASGTHAASVAVGAGCRAYHFVAVDAAGASWRYPAAGEFQTYGEGSCADDWAP
ncbi:MAG TPA: CAP domain-containing protein, partial [Thermoanaerobaculia bacterium]|nr:CAP domain-containing protein [Thermoanaerobaculia bacterium]